MSEEINNRINFASGLSWEPLRGYSRAVQVGKTLYVSGMTSVNEKADVIGPDNPYLQTKYALENLRYVLKRAGFQMHHVVRTKLSVTDMSRWKDYAHAHREIFDNIRPASSIVEVTALIDPRMMVEIEAEAVLCNSQASIVTINLDESEHDD